MADIIQTHIRNSMTDEFITWFEGAVFPPPGTVVELFAPNRDAVVVSTRLIAMPDHRAIVLLSVQDEKEEGGFVPRHPADRLSPDWRERETPG
jgi:hypothetical protein